MFMWLTIFYHELENNFTWNKYQITFLDINENALFFSKFYQNFSLKTTKSDYFILAYFNLISMEIGDMN